jgi:hypothetical protein
MAKIGQLVPGGRPQGMDARSCQKGWIEASTAFASSRQRYDQDYVYLWWKLAMPLCAPTKQSAGSECRSVEEGNSISIVPELDLVRRA